MRRRRTTSTFSSPRTAPSSSATARGDEVHDVQPRTPNAAIKPPGADGQSVNALEVKVAGNTIWYSVNGTVVHTTPRTGLTARTDGLTGVRVNHQLDVRVDGFSIGK